MLLERSSIHTQDFLVLKSYPAEAEMHTMRPEKNWGTRMDKGFWVLSLLLTIKMEYIGTGCYSQP